MAKKSAVSKTDTFIKLALVFFISLLSFTLGTYVGKQVSDSEYQSAKYDAEDYKQFRKEASLEESEKHEGLSDEEIASLTEEFVNKDKSEDRKIASTDEHKHDGADHKHHEAPKADIKDGYAHMSGKDKKEKPKAKEAHDHKHAAKAEHKQPEAKKEAPAKPKKAAATHASTKEAARVASGKALKPDPKPKRKQASAFPTVASSSIGKYTVQVASYSTEEEAKNRSLTLRNKGFEAFYVPAKIKGRTWFRVSVGLFDNHKSANKFKATLMKQANISSAFVSKIIK